jgi:hypothetical protein
MKTWNLTDKSVSELRNQTYKKTAELTDQFGETLANIFKKLSIKWLQDTHSTLKAHLAFSLKTEFDSCAETGIKYFNQTPTYINKLYLILSRAWRKCGVQFVQMHGWERADFKEFLEKL